MGYVISDDGRFVAAKWIGAIGHREAIDHETRLLRDVRLGRCACVLSDTRLATFPETGEHNVAEFAALHGRPDNLGSVSRSAICSVAVETFDKAKLYREECFRFGVEVELFADVPPACAWLGVDQAVAEELLARLGTGAG
ncbi:MAG TPA: hypothetical protein DCY13_15945 [Verrucomicrobiales bacterium]|nr:hypothetical protein [Verrucomicrobiales bacterium]